MALQVQKDFPNHHAPDNFSASRVLWHPFSSSNENPFQDMVLLVHSSRLAFSSNLLVMLGLGNSSGAEQVLRDSISRHQKHV